MKKARVNISHSRFILFKLKIFGEIVTTNKLSQKKNSILHHNQYGFRSGLSTSHALLDVVTTAYDDINKMLYTLLIFIDYKKAFNTVRHKLLLSKLEHHRIRTQLSISYHLT